MEITVLYNRVSELLSGRPEEILADEDTVITARKVADSLVILGYSVDLFEVNKKTLRSLSKHRTDLFFNLAEGISNLPDTEYEVIALLEKTQKPFTGSGSKTLQFTTDKAKTKKTLEDNHLLTPAYQVINAGDKLDPKLQFPLVVKPVAKDGSVGINGHSVLDNAADVIDQVDFLTKTYQEPALVEEYIDGRELNATVLGNGENALVLPISEVIFGQSFEGKYKVVNFAAKWEEDTSAYKDSNGICPAKLDRKIFEAINDFSLRAFAITGCRDYARIDLRLTPDGKPYILEVNANPGLAPDSGVVRSAKAAGYSYPQFLEKIITVAINRFSSR